MRPLAGSNAGNVGRLRVWMGEGVLRLFMWDNNSNTLCVGLKKRLVIYQYNGLEFLEVRAFLGQSAFTPTSTQGSAASSTGTAYAHA